MEIQPVEVLLVFPRVYKRNILGSKSYLRPPLSLVSLATYLGENGVGSEVIDLNLEKDHSKALRGSIRSGSPSIVGIGLLSPTQIDSALKTSELVKRENPDAKIVWGGAFINSLPNKSVKDPRIDIIVKGEGEETLLELAKRLKMGSDLKDVDGIIYEKSGKVVETKDRDFIDMNKLPFADYSYVNKYLRTYKNYTSELLIEGSRGCPNRCAYCNTPGFNRFKWRSKTPRRIVDELKYMNDQFGKKYGFEFYYLVDSNPWVKKSHLEGFSGEMAKSELDINLKSFDHLDYIDSKRLSMMEKTGFKRLMLGLESGSERILKVLNRRTAVDEYLKKLELFNSFGITPALTLMLGIPGETIQEMIMTLNLADRAVDICPKSLIGFDIYYPFPKTSLYNLGQSLGEKLPENLDEFRGFSKIDRIEKDAEDLYYTASFVFNITSLRNARPGKKQLSLVSRVIGPQILKKYKKRDFRPSIKTRLIRLLMSPGM